MKSLMMTLPLVFLVVVLSLSLILPVSQCRVVLSTRPNGNNLIEETCKRTPNYDLCVSCLGSDPESSKANLTGLGLIMVDVLKGKAEETAKKINGLLKGNPKANEKAALSDCAERYDAVLEADIPEAILAIKTGDYKFAEQGTNDAAVEADLCEKNFSSATSPLTQVNKFVHDVAAVAAAISRILLTS